MQKQNDEALSLGKGERMTRSELKPKRGESRKCQVGRKKWKGNGMHQIKAVGRVLQAREKQRSRLAAFPQTGLNLSSSIFAIK